MDDNIKKNVRERGGVLNQNHPFWDRHYWRDVVNTVMELVPKQGGEFI
jgi:hypothetical protein